MKRIIILGEISIEDQRLIRERLNEFEVLFFNPDIKVFNSNTESIAAKGIGIRVMI